MRKTGVSLKDAIRKAQIKATSKEKVKPGSEFLLKTQITRINRD